MKASNYFDRAMRSSDRRYGRILSRLGYGSYQGPDAAKPAKVNKEEIANPLDHDGDGKAGGSVADDLAAMRAEYLALVGKRAFPGWDADTLRKKMNEYRTRMLKAEG